MVKDITPDTGGIQRGNLLMMLKPAVQAIEIIKVPAHVQEQKHQQTGEHMINKKTDDEGGDGKGGNAPGFLYPGVIQNYTCAEKRYPAPRTVWM